MNQMEDGKNKLGLDPQKKLNNKMMIRAFEAGCTAGGMKERLYHLEGKKGYKAKKLLNEGYSVEAVYFHIFYNKKID